MLSMKQVVIKAAQPMTEDLQGMFLWQLRVIFYLMK